MNGMARFKVGQIIRHKLFDYRGVIADFDPEFIGTEAWYRRKARSRPPKDAPWYHVLIDDSDDMSYVAERNLEADESGAPVANPLVSELFDGVEDGIYTRLGRPDVN